jgi:hypothetical protein
MSHVHITGNVNIRDLLETDDGAWSVELVSLDDLVEQGEDITNEDCFGRRRRAPQLVPCDDAGEPEQ